MREAGQPAPAVLRWRKVRFRLAHLLAWILGVAVLLTLWRHVQLAEWFGPFVDGDRILGLSAAVLAVCLGFGLLRQSWKVYRSGYIGPQPGQLGWIAWRLAVVGVLALFVSEQASHLGDKDAYEDPEGWVLVSVLPATATMGMAGIASCLGHRRIRKDRPRLLWLSVTWAVVAGVLITMSQLLLPILKLIWIEAVKVAFHHPERRQMLDPGLHARLIHAGFMSVPAFVACFLLALQLAYELRPRLVNAAEPNPPHCRLLLALVATTTATAILSGRLIYKAVPSVSEWMAEGFELCIGWRAIIAIVLSFASLALALTAGATHPQVQVEHMEPLKTSKTGRTGAFIFTIMLAFAAVHTVLAPFNAVASSGDNSWASWLRRIYLVFAWTTRLLPGSAWRSLQALILCPEWLVLLLTQVWIARRIQLIVMSPSSSDPTPIDSLFGNPHALPRFLIRWTALTVLFTTAIPILFLVGLALLAYSLHITVR